MYVFIIQAIKKGNGQAVKDWLEKVPPMSVNDIVDSRRVTYENEHSLINSEKMTALHYAAFFCKTSIIDLLLGAGAGNYILWMNLATLIWD